MTAAFVVSWLVQGLIISALFAATAALLQWIARDAVPARAIWGAALLGATVLTFTAPLRLEPAGTVTAFKTVSGVPTDAAASLVQVDGAVGLAAFADRVSALAGALFDAPHAAVRGATDGLSSRVALTVLAIWIVGAIALMIVLAIAHRRLRDALRSAEPREIDGAAVRLTTDLGPAVVGVRAPVVVVPRWLLSLPLAEQLLVVRHERAHIAARDPLLLLSGVALAALQPWNPFAWLMVRRLRLAIELDCDRRLLRSGTSPRAYGDLLIALAGASSPALRPAVLHPMFSHHHTHLAQRIIAMTERPVRLISARRLTVAALASVAVLAACESRLPTDAEIRDLDAAVLEEKVVGTLIPATAGEPVWYVNGQKVASEVAKEIPANRIASVRVIKGEQAEIRIDTEERVLPDKSPSGIEQVTVLGRPLDASARAEEVERPMVTVRDGAPIRILQRDASAQGGEFMKGFTGVFVVDGVVTPNEKFYELKPDQLESVEVIKGQAGVLLYGEKARNGVISVRLKPRR